MLAAAGTTHFAIPGTGEQIQHVADSLQEIYQELGLTGKQVSSLKLALGEAISNAVCHGHGGDRSRQVAIDCEWNPAAVTLTVTDQGQGFNWRRVPNPTCGANLLKDCGRGLYIISAIMSGLTFNEAGNQIRMTLKREQC